MAFPHWATGVTTTTSVTECTLYSRHRASTFLSRLVSSSQPPEWASGSLPPYREHRGPERCVTCPTEVPEQQVEEGGQEPGPAWATQEPMFFRLPSLAHVTKAVLTLRATSSYLFPLWPPEGLYQSVLLGNWERAASSPCRASGSPPMSWQAH